MRMLEQLQQKIESVATMGIEARAEARALGISSYYVDPEYPEAIVEEKADGSRVFWPLNSQRVETGKHAAE